MKENKNMKIGDLKKIIANLPDDMDVMIPVCETNHKFDYYCHHYVNLAGLIYNNNHDKVLALYSTKDNSVTSFRDCLDLTIPNTVCTKELYSNYYHQLVTLRDYKKCWGI